MCLQCASLGDYFHNRVFYYGDYSSLAQTYRGIQDSTQLAIKFAYFEEIVAYLL